MYLLKLRAGIESSRMLLKMGQDIAVNAPIPATSAVGTFVTTYGFTSQPKGGAIPMLGLWLGSDSDAVLLFTPVHCKLRVTAF